MALIPRSGPAFFLFPFLSLFVDILFMLFSNNFISRSPYAKLEVHILASFGGQQFTPGHTPFVLIFGLIVHALPQAR